MEPTAECMLVTIDATPEGRKELLGFQVNVRESAQSWRELLIDMKARGLRIAPELAVADDALVCKGKLYAGGFPRTPRNGGSGG
jgi:putative transposase